MTEKTELPESLTINFKPFKLLGKEYKSITLRPPSFGEVERATNAIPSELSQGAMMGYNKSLISACAEVPEGVVELMPYNKVKAATRFLSLFLEATDDTGNEH